MEAESTVDDWRLDLATVIQIMFIVVLKSRQTAFAKIKKSR